MVDPNIELAKQGNSQAIATLIADKLGQELVISHKIEGELLKLVIETSRKSDKQQIVTTIRELVTELEIDSISQVKVSGQRARAIIPEWDQEFGTDNILSLATSKKNQASASAPPSKNEFLESLKTFDFASVFPYQ